MRAARLVRPVVCRAAAAQNVAAEGGATAARHYRRHHHQAVRRAVSRAPSRCFAGVAGGAAAAGVGAAPAEDLGKASEVRLSSTGIQHASISRVYPDMGVAVGMAAYVIPHSEKWDKGGEDAFFICARSYVSSDGKHASIAAAGVADGVGGWASQGVDPREYSANLMRKALLVYQHGEEKSELPVEFPQEVLADANRRVSIMKKPDGAPIQGSCTATVVTIERATSDDGKTSLHASWSNVGDSGVWVMRRSPIDDRWNLVAATEEQQHYFNCPFQLPSDDVRTADRGRFALEVGDLVVLSSDGVLDNLWPKELAEAVDDLEVHDGHVNPSEEEIAKRIADAANNIMSDSQHPTPFSLKSNRRWSGGKEDDIVVVVMRVLGNPPVAKL